MRIIDLDAIEAGGINSLTPDDLDNWADLNDIEAQLAEDLYAADARAKGDAALEHDSLAQAESLREYAAGLRNIAKAARDDAAEAFEV